MNFKLRTVLIVLLTIVFFAPEAEAQKKKRRKTREDRDKPEKIKASFKDNLVYEVNFGNPSFFGVGGSSSFNLALKPAVAYKLAKPIAAGIYAKGDYLFVRQGGQEFSLLDYGFGTYAKLRVLDFLHLRGEFGYVSYSYERNSGIIQRGGFFEPMAGLGYRPGGEGPWHFGGEVLFHLNKDVREYSNQVVELWLQASYRF